jgi:hypothetical protein
LSDRNDRMLQCTINVRKSQHQPQCTLQLVCEDRVLFVWVYLHVSLCRHHHAKCEQAIHLMYPPLLCKHQFHKTKINGVSVCLCVCVCVCVYVERERERDAQAFRDTSNRDYAEYIQFFILNFRCAQYCFHFWVYPQRLVYIGRCFGTLCRVHLQRLESLTEGSETSANINQTLGIHPKVETILSTAKV